MGREKKPRPLKKTWDQAAAERAEKNAEKRSYAKDPWNNPQSKLELFISPTLEIQIRARKERPDDPDGNPRD